MSYLPSKTCFQSLRFTHCMPASLLSAPPPFPPPIQALHPSAWASSKVCRSPIHIASDRFIGFDAYLSLPFSRQHGHFSPNLFGPGVALDCGCCHSLAPPHSPLSPAHSPPPQPGVPHDFLRVVLSSDADLTRRGEAFESVCPVAALFLLPHPPHHHQPTPVGSTTPFFWPPRASGPFTCCVHVISSPSIAISAPLSSRGGSPLVTNSHRSFHVARLGSSFPRN